MFGVLMKPFSSKFNTPSQKKTLAFPHHQCLAKTWTRSDGSVSVGRSVVNHCTIVGEIARCLINSYPEQLRLLLFPTGSELVAASHDIGKVSPSFVAKLMRACGTNFQSIPELVTATPDLEYTWGGHAGVSQATADSLGVPKYVAEILGQHHGFNPNVDDKCGNAEVFGGDSWFEERKNLVAALKIHFETDWPVFNNASQARVVAGLTSVADWIGSGSFFEDPQQDWRGNIQVSLQDAGFIKPNIVTDLSFSQIFDPLNNAFQPRRAQSLFIDQVTGPGVYLLEAQMGMGKTEAALYAAYKMLVEKKATGIYFALPTQLTSNKIYDRFNLFLDQIIGPKTPHRALLLHSGSWLLEQSEMGEEGRPGGAWFNQNKRGLLAPFSVGTIDQALMAVMNVKHGFVRAFGLAGKVVILDEVHSYDLYTGTILTELVLFLRQIGCTVIILSATLNRRRREDLLQQKVTSNHYPLITASAADSDSPAEIAATESNNTSVAVTLCDRSDHVVDEALLRAEQGQQVLWIENTVAEAQQRYLDLASRAISAGCDIGLLHSRFTPQDRQKNEAYWVTLFGKRGWPKRLAQGRILIGTQVLEQSLDIDADFLVSRFAPTDMLLQRVGRLWRHQDTPRSNLAQRECWLLAPDLDEALSQPKTTFGPTASIYAPYVLCRSLEVWQGVELLELPSDIRNLIDQTYSDREENNVWQSLLYEMKQGSRYRTGETALQALARLTLAKGGKTLPEHKAETRYSDQDTHDLLLIRAVAYDIKAKVTRIRLMDNRELIIPHARYRLSKSDWKKLAVTLHQQLVRIKPGDCPPKINKVELEKLHMGSIFYLGNPQIEEALLRIALVKEGGELNTLDGSLPVVGKVLEYREDLGYRVITEKD